MPLQFMLASDAQRRIRHYAHVERTGAAELIGTPVGQIVGRTTHVRSAQELIREIAEEYVDTMDRMNGLMDVDAAPKRRHAAAFTRSSSFQGS